MTDIIKNINALELLGRYTVAKSLGQEDEFCKSLGVDIEKGGKVATIGEIRDWNGKKFKKQNNGKWIEVSEYGYTKETHERFANDNRVDTSNVPQSSLDYHTAQKKLHAEAASKLSSKEHSDEEVGIKDKEDFHDKYTPEQAALAADKAKTESKYKDWTAQQHIEQSWQHHGAMVRARNQKKDSVARWEENEMNRHVSLAAEKTKKEVEGKSKPTIHIGDMSKEQKYATAVKFGIQNPEKLSVKELDKQLIDKNVEAELKKFRENKK